MLEGAGITDVAGVHELFKEILNKHVAYNLNIMRKLALNLLKLIDVVQKC